MTPITPRTSKKMFMDALLAPATLTQEPLYDRDKAADIFAPGHADISITVGIYMCTPVYWEVCCFMNNYCGYIRT